MEFYLMNMISSLKTIAYNHHLNMLSAQWQTIQVSNDHRKLTSQYAYCLSSLCELRCCCKWTILSVIVFMYSTVIKCW